MCVLYMSNVYFIYVYVCSMYVYSVYIIGTCMIVHFRQSQIALGVTFLWYRCYPEERTIVRYM